MAPTTWLPLLLYILTTFFIPLQTVEALVKRAMPKLTLPYATYEAANYNPLSDVRSTSSICTFPGPDDAKANGDFQVYTFKNVRFAAPPLGDLRWAIPEQPLVEPGVQNGSVGFACTQSLPAGLNVGSGSRSPKLDYFFLDVYVPGKAIRGEVAKLPVIVWIYGCGYSAGSKDGGISLGLYDGTGPIVSSGGNIIVVTFNYRVGVYGCLAGRTVEAEAVANAGLHDQYAAFEWANKYISILGGDSNTVSAWGESAGAGSIYRLLTRESGTSPGFPDKIDRNCSIERDYQKFEKAAGCEGQGLACLRNTDASIINQANDLVTSNPIAPVVFSPAPDGIYFRQHPAVEFALGNNWAEMDSVIPSHCLDEGALFVNHSILTDKDLNDYLEYTWPAYAVKDYDVVNKIEAEYPSAAFKTEADRYKAIIAQSSFLYNTNFLSVAYSGKTYNAQFSALNGTHGSDVLPTWYDPFAFTNVSGIELPLWSTSLFKGLPIPGVARGYQSYLVSHARFGNPNSNQSLNIPPTIEWPVVGGHPDGSSPNYLWDVLNVTDTGFELIEDRTQNRSICLFWGGIIFATTVFGGYDFPRLAGGWRV
ncbi:alpha/beta-hydrolase [Mytilinidion resinicola]|uniref:Alpha/beta-hydrolase n=1 Tax=Mytilinidion resinicola TaxID=574789 RepID=A0A6A6Z6E2_9PEZI|nr:alpha/beta-hydrolase [Mytilinidion resinicola]KAF2816279.1 alpha/beta-hydrolase [Mytilinidion resinicola]